jgi:hypothetical protein
MQGEEPPQFLPAEWPREKPEATFEPLVYETERAQQEWNEEGLKYHFSLSSVFPVQYEFPEQHRIAL